MLAPSSEVLTASCAKNHTESRNAIKPDSIKPATMKPAAACDCYPRQHRRDLLGTASCLATATLPPLLIPKASCPKRFRTQFPAIESTTAKGTQSNPVTPKAFEKRFSEISMRSEKQVLGLSIARIVVLAGNVLDAARKISQLKQSVLTWSSISVDQCLLGKHVLECRMEDIRDESLPVVVVNLYGIVFLKLIQALKEKEGEVSSHPCGKITPRFKPTLFICKGVICKRNTPGKRREAPKHANTVSYIHAAVAIISMRQHDEMKRVVRQLSLSNNSFIVAYEAANVAALVVKNQRQHVVRGICSQVARLVNKDRKLTHAGSLQKQKSRGFTPALDGPPKAETHLFYTTDRFGFSSIDVFEHMFSIMHTNTRSAYRKAA